MSEPTIQELIEKLVPDAVLTALSRKPEKVKAVLIKLINQYARAEGEITELRARVADLEKDAGRYRWVRSQKALEVHRFMLWADSMPDLDEMIDKAMRVRQ